MSNDPLSTSVSVITVPSVNLDGPTREICGKHGTEGSGPETGRLDQPHLVTTGRELTTLVALNHHPTPGLDANDAGANPTQSC